MEFKNDYEVKGERVREYFALFPVKIGRKIKFWEKVIVKEEFRYGSSEGTGWYKGSFIETEPKLGDTRFLYSFLWRPKKLKGWSRWLCWATVSQLHNGEDWTDQWWAHYL